MVPLSTPVRNLNELRTPAKRAVRNPMVDDLLPRIEPAPCDGCRFTKRCGSHHLPCHVYALFLDGRGDKLRWQNVRRVPTRARDVALRLDEAACAGG